MKLRDAIEVWQSRTVLFWRGFALHIHALDMRDGASPRGALFVGDRRLKPVAIVHGDRVEFGASGLPNNVTVKERDARASVWLNPDEQEVFATENGYDLPDETAVEVRRD